MYGVMTSLQVDKPSTFNVNLNGALGTLKSFVKTPSGTEEDVFSQELDQDEHAMRFIPHENGVFYVHIKFNEAHIPGSPFPMLVGKLGADPALVFAHGDGLEKGEVGALQYFRILLRFCFSFYLFIFIPRSHSYCLSLALCLEWYNGSITPRVHSGVTRRTECSYSTDCPRPFNKCVKPLSGVKGKGKGQVLDIALLHDEHMLRSALQSRKWQLIGLS